MCEKRHVISDNDEDEEKNIKCKDCLRTFPTLSCYRTHREKEKGKPISHYVKPCSKCGAKIDFRPRKTTHVCGERYCKLFQTYVEQTHFCIV